MHTAVVHTGVRAKELCALLIQYGADPYIQNHNRESNNVRYFFLIFKIFFIFLLLSLIIDPNYIFY